MLEYLVEAGTWSIGGLVLGYLVGKPLAEIRVRLDQFEERAARREVRADEREVRDDQREVRDDQREARDDEREEKRKGRP